MKRCAELRELSVDHHHGLVAARRLRVAAEGWTPLDMAITEFLSAWRQEILPHFRLEEKILLAEFARVAGSEHPLIVRTLNEHIGLRSLAAELETARPEEGRELAERMSAALEAHIRFEERVLFPALEAQFPEAVLARVGERLQNAEDAELE